MVCKTHPMEIGYRLLPSGVFELPGLQDPDLVPEFRGPLEIQLPGGGLHFFL